MKVAEKNRRTMAALGIQKIEWSRNRARESDWRVILFDGSEIIVTTSWGGTESTVIRDVARMFAAEGRPVRYAS